MRILIVEDETAAADNLSCLLNRIDKSIEIAGVSESVEDTVDILRNDRDIDLIFMDIHLSDGSAFAIFDKLEVDIPVIFTTAYDQYALDAFKVNSIDYLLKPIKQTDLSAAIAKYRRRMPAEMLAYIASMSAIRARNDYPRRLLVPQRDKLLPVSVTDICYIYSTNRRTEIVLTDTRAIAINKTLEQMESMLDPQLFIRANKQFILSKDAINELVAWFDSRLLVRMTVDTPEEIFISKNRVAEFKRWLTE